MNKPFEISIVILCKNEENYISDVLKSIINQKIDGGFEVIVIDSGSSDRSLKIVKKYPVRLIEIKPEFFSHGRTRNYGVKISRGKYIVFLNADAVPINKYWLRNLIMNLQKDGRAAGVYSRIYPRNDCNPLRYWEILNDNYYFDEHKREKFIDNFGKYNKMSAESKRKLISFHTISCAIKREVFKEYSFRNISFGEDLEWSKRIMENGYKIIYEPESKIIHSHNFYNSFSCTVRKYFNDTKLNNYLLNRWSFKNIYKLLIYIAYKVYRDFKYIVSLKETKCYKLGWVFYSPVIRLAELFGILLVGLNNLLYKIQSNKIL